MKAQMAVFYAVAALAAAPAVAADLIIKNAKVFTVDAGSAAADAVAITGARISFVGSTAQANKLARTRTRIIDAGGRLLTPGLIEAHTHVGPDIPGQRLQLPGGMWPGPSPKQVIEAVRAAALKGEGWIVGTIGPATTSQARDWRSELDAVSRGRPVRLRAWWGHGTILNTAALRQLGVNDGAADPIGGWYGRRADGALDGLVREQAEAVIARRMTEEVPAEASAAAFRDAASQYAKWGVTTIHKMAHNYRLETALVALNVAKSPVNWTIYGWAWPDRTPSDAWVEFAANPVLPRNVRIGGIKWVLDSTPIERDALLEAPYADRPGQRGRSNYSDAQLRQILEMGLRRPEQLALHIVGDAEARRVFAMMDTLAPASRWVAKRVRIEHGDGITPGLLPAAKRLGVVVVQNPLHVLPDKDETGRPWLLNRLGRDRVDDFQLLRSLTEAGIPLALGSDAGGEVANPFLNMMFAVRYERNPGEALTREQALAAYTSGAAYAEGQEKEKGKIAVGMTADLALLSQDVLSVPLQALPATRSLLTIVNGSIVHEDLTGAP
jgi:predicted amidohydrolase YtcJ